MRKEAEKEAVISNIWRQIEYWEDGIQTDDETLIAIIDVLKKYEKE